MNEVAANQRKAAMKHMNHGVAPILKQFYLDCLSPSPGLIDLLGDGKLVEDGPHLIVQSAVHFLALCTHHTSQHLSNISNAQHFGDSYLFSGA
jgi:hypothetical protein